MAAGNSTQRMANIPSTAGTMTVPLARIAPTSTLLQPRSTTLQATVRIIPMAISSACGSCRNSRSATGASAWPTATKAVVTSAFSQSPVFTTAGTRWLRPAPITWELRMDAAMPRHMAGNWIQLRSWVAAP